MDVEWLSGGRRRRRAGCVCTAARLVHLAQAADPGGYVYRAVLNQLRSWQRRQRLERRYAFVESELASAPPEISAMGEFLATLSERQRAAVVLRFYCDLPLAEVAGLMGCRRGTVSVLLRRALGKARTMKEVFES